MYTALSHCTILFPLSPPFTLCPPFPPACSLKSAEIDAIKAEYQRLLDGGGETCGPQAGMHKP